MRKRVMITFAISGFIAWSMGVWHLALRNAPDQQTQIASPTNQDSTAVLKIVKWQAPDTQAFYQSIRRSGLWPEMILDPSVPSNQGESGAPAKPTLDKAARSGLKKFNLKAISQVGNRCWAVFEVDKKRIRATVGDKLQEGQIIKSIEATGVIILEGDKETRFDLFRTQQ
ncbi:MAG: hypothetical protein CR991_03140 [Proteobacteria bacterium]|nr:MAG: hypothetical protein CR991_03140 [Pseudomonadota bacterium]